MIISDAQWAKLNPILREAIEAALAQPATAEPAPAEVLPIGTISPENSNSGEWVSGYSNQRNWIVFSASAAATSLLKAGRTFITPLGQKAKIVEVNVLYGKPHLVYETEDGKALTATTGALQVFEGTEPGKPEAPEAETPAPAPVDAKLPLIGVNFAGLGNNPSVDAVATAEAPTNYRTIVPVFKKTVQPDYVAMYRPKNGGPWLARIPFAGERIAILDGKGGFTLREGYVSEILAVIRALAAANCSVLPDMHNYCRWYIPIKETIAGRNVGSYNGKLALWSPIGHPECPVSYELLGKIWAAIAERFKGEPNIFAWGLMNEPHSRGDDPKGYDVGKAWEDNVQGLINAVRKVDTKTAIAVCGGFYGQAKTWPTTSAGLLNLTDPSNNLFYEAHQYPDNKGGGGGTWSRDSAGVLKETSVDGAARAADWDPFLNWLKQHKKRGIAGEFGGPGDLAGMQDYFRLLYDKFEAAGVPSFQWLAGPGDSDTYPNGMDRNDGTLKPAADEFVKRAGRTVKKYGTV